MLQREPLTQLQGPAGDKGEVRFLHACTHTWHLSIPVMHTGGRAHYPHAETFRTTDDITVLSLLNCTTWVQQPGTDAIIDAGAKHAGRAVE